MSSFLKKYKDIFISLLFAVALFFFILTFSISLPIYCRPFYYAHIDSMNLSEESGFTKEEIIEAYDAVLDYLTIPDKEFSSGVMKYSPEGESHFADCKALFNLNATVLLSSAVCILILLILRKTGKTAPFLIGKHQASFYSALAAVLLPIIIGSIAALDFDKAFEVFHRIFFPGKTNWTFNPRTDEIIEILPQEFFMNCAILIGISILLFSGILILIDGLRTRKNRRL